MPKQTKGEEPRSEFKTYKIPGGTREVGETRKVGIESASEKMWYVVMTSNNKNQS